MRPFVRVREGRAHSNTTASRFLILSPLFERPEILGQFGLDLFIKEELREGMDLGPEELIGAVDGVIGHSESVSPHGICQMTNAHRLQMLVLRIDLDEHLIVQIVTKLRHEFLEGPHNLQNVLALKIIVEKHGHHI